MTGAGLHRRDEPVPRPGRGIRDDDRRRTSDETTSECGFGQRLVSLWTALPETLQEDLKNLRDLPEGERGDAARDIREAARDGEYGDAVQRHAWRVRDRRIFLWSTMSEELRADLTEIRAADPADRQALVDQLAQNALDGTYGERAQHIAQRIQEHCAAD